MSILSLCWRHAPRAKDPSRPLPRFPRFFRSSGASCCLVLPSADLYWYGEALAVTRHISISRKARSSPSATSAAASCRSNGPSSKPAGSDGALALPDSPESHRTRDTTTHDQQTRLDYIRCPFASFSPPFALGPSFIIIPLRQLYRSLRSHPIYIIASSFCCFSSHSLDTNSAAPQLPGLASPFSFATRAPRWLLPRI